MSPKTRQDKILDLVRRQGRASVEELAELFSASRETIRRDLNALSDADRIQKVHGGARVASFRGEGPFRQRMDENADAKRAIAQHAAALIGEGDTLFIDTGSTTLIYAETVASVDGLTVITNSTAIARAFGRNEKAAAIYLLGGAYDPDNRETAGPMALAQIPAFHADHAVITVGGVHADAGFTDYNIAEAQIAGAMIENAESLIILADSSKFERAGPYAVCPLERADYFVTDRKPAPHLKRALSASKVQVIC